MELWGNQNIRHSKSFILLHFPRCDFLLTAGKILGWGVLDPLVRIPVPIGTPFNTLLRQILVNAFAIGCGNKVLGVYVHHPKDESFCDGVWRKRIADFKCSCLCCSTCSLTCNSLLLRSTYLHNAKSTISCVRARSPPQQQHARPVEHSLSWDPSAPLSNGPKLVWP